MQLSQLHQRIKGSRLFVGQKNGIERLYINYRTRGRDIKNTVWFQVVNDRIRPFARVQNVRKNELYDGVAAARIEEELHRKFHEIINDCELERRKVPLHERLRDDIDPVHENSLMHQAQALRFCCSMKVTALFADTGTGKTKVAVDLAVSRFEAGQIKKVQIFCPVSTKKNFRDEIEKWYKGSGLEWRITGLESMSSSDTEVLGALAFCDHETFIIIDESHNCKTPFAKRSKRIRACCEKASYKLLLTGTPAESVRDLYMQYCLLSELIIGEKNWLTFEEKYLVVDERGDVIAYKNVDHLMGLVEPYTYQIRKEDVLQLPDKRFKIISSYLNSTQSELYEQTKQELLERLEKFEDEMVPATLIFQYFTYLQQISCGFIKDPDGNISDLGNGKFYELHKTGYQDGQTIFFAKYLYEVDQLVGFLGRENCAIFTGTNPKERDAEKDMFTSGEKKYFVATMGAGGTGLNGLQHCNRVVFFSNTFKWIQRKQCIGRIDRQGQQKEMDIYDMRPECGIEYRILNNLARKGNLADEIKELLHDKTRLKKYLQEL